MTGMLFAELPPEGLGPPLEPDWPWPPSVAPPPPPQATRIAASAQAVAIRENDRAWYFMGIRPRSAYVVLSGAGRQQRGHMRGTGEAARQLHDMHGETITVYGQHLVVEMTGSGGLEVIRIMS